VEFFKKLKILFEKIPIKNRFLSELGVNTSYSGFRYFMQGRKPEPSTTFLKKVCSNIDYEYIQIPIKLTDDGQKYKEELINQFLIDLEKHLDKYSGDKSRIYVKDFGKTSVVSSAVEAFSQDINDDLMDIDDLF